ncbi:MAG: CDP-glucose 4,6-dehydratase [Rhizomicrobium sp.]
MADESFWSGQRVLLTGHTGFKGAWLSIWLARMGAQVHGYSLGPDSEPNLFGQLGGAGLASSRIGDIRDRAALAAAVDEIRPTVAIHMAAQALVRRSYREPVETFETNVMGSVNFLDALRRQPSLRAALVITTDKVYRNLETGRAFQEDDALGAHDPYSASKAAAEIAVSSWRQSFFQDTGIPVAAARAGNVIGGGDWSEDRLVPDIWRAITRGEELVLRYPDATRPWQHVLEPLAGYLRYVEQIATSNAELPSALNFGPSPQDVLKVSELAEMLLEALAARKGWRHEPSRAMPEMNFLSLDPALARKTIGWRPRLSSRECAIWTAEWYRRWGGGEDARALCLEQISRYEELL